MKELSTGKKETLKVGAITFVANIIGKMISIPVGIFVAGFLGPTAYGILAIVNQTKTILGYGNLGILMNLTRELPIAYGKKDFQEVQIIKDVVFTNYTITTVLGLLVFWGLSRVQIIPETTIDIYMLLFVTVLVITSNVDSFLHTYVKGEGRFMIFGQYEFVNKLANPLLTLVSVYFFGLYGMIGALIATHLVGSTYTLFRIGNPKINFRLDANKTKVLLSTSIFMYINKLLDTFLISVSILIAGVFFSLSQVGILSYALVIASTSQIPFADIFAMTTDRHMAFHSGQFGTDSYSSYAKYLELPLVMFSLLSSTILGLIVIFYSYTVEIFLEKYITSLPMFIVLYFAMIFYNTRHFVYSYINATRQMNKRSIYLVIGLLMNVAIAMGLIALGTGIISIVYALAISFIFISASSILLVFKQVYENNRTAAVFFIRILVIACCLTLLLYYFTRIKLTPITEVVSGNLYSSVFVIFELIFKLVLFTLFSLGIFSYTFKDYKVLNEIKNYSSYFYKKLKIKLGA